MIKRLGLIGGSGWPSTLEYYRLLNTYFGERRGGGHALDFVLRNLDFEVFRELLDQGQKPKAVRMLIEGALDCKKAGATFLAFSANGLHRFWPEMKEAVDLPLVHIAEATAQAVSSSGLKTVGLLGVRATMEASFYPEHLRELGIATLIPNDADKAQIDRIIFEELVRGTFTKASKVVYLQVMDRLVQRGAEGIILGCTEIPLLINQTDSVHPLFATTEIHCKAILKFALN
ncbi:MAG: aspartate/glutamate racemase family protein [Bdellovibrionales bacterium]